MLTDKDKDILYQLMFVNDWDYGKGFSAGGKAGDNLQHLIKLGFLDDTKHPDREWYTLKPTKLFGWLRRHLESEW